jgi:hypothetical protein
MKPVKKAPVVFLFPAEVAANGIAGSRNVDVAQTASEKKENSQ